MTKHMFCCWPKKSEAAIPALEASDRTTVYPQTEVKMEIYNFMGIC